jgi:hypothetical protein
LSRSPATRRMFLQDRQPACPAPGPARHAFIVTRRHAAQRLTRVALEPAIGEDP